LLPWDGPAVGAYLLIQSLVSEEFVVKLRLRERESIQEAVRRFRKLVEHSGIKKEMRRREFYEKPSDKRRRARRRAERRAKMARMPML
jgi:small subunit ribosomal protein S21